MNSKEKTKEFKKRLYRFILRLTGLTRCHSERSPDSHRDELREVKNLSIYLRISHTREILR